MKKALLSAALSWAALSWAALTWLLAVAVWLVLPGGSAQAEGTDAEKLESVPEAAIAPARLVESIPGGSSKHVESIPGGAEDVDSEALDSEPSAPPLDSAARAFWDDLRLLTRHPHRLSGSPQAAAAAEHIQNRLRGLGIEDVWTLDMPVWQTRTLRAALVCEAGTAELYPLRPNVVVPPVTPPEGVRGPLIYVGRSDLTAYAARHVEGAVVALDYDSHDAWERAFALGARAVVFLGTDESATPIAPRHANVPSNQLRLYAPASAVKTCDLTRDHERVTLFSHVVWQRPRGRNVVARIRGTAPRAVSAEGRHEVIVGATPYDSYGVVPELSGGARTAANVAALLETAERLAQAPPRRDVLLLFLDNHGRGQQGAREVYAALQMSDAEAHRHLTELEQELAHVQAMKQVLDSEGPGYAPQDDVVGGASVTHWLQHDLQKEADFARDDLQKQIGVLRLRKAGDSARASELERAALRWDRVRRAIHQDDLRGFVEEQTRLAAGDASEARAYVAILERMSERTSARFERRVRELGESIAIARQRDELRKRLGFFDGPDGARIVLHASYAFGDQGETWGVVVGDWSHALFPWRQPRTDGDMPGYYGRLLGAIAESVSRELMPNLEPRTLSDPTLGLAFAPRPFVSSGAIAGAYGIYNVSFMTGHDGRLRDGHPADTLEHLHWQRLRAQSLEAGALFGKIADSPALSLTPVFKSLAVTRRPGWARGQSTGDSAGLVVSGSLAENRPAAGALLAMWPGQKAWLRQAWETLDGATLSSFDPLLLEPVTESGRFGVVGLREDMHDELMIVGALFDDVGRVTAISTTDTQVQKLTEAMRVHLIGSIGGAWTALHTYDARPELLKLLKASSDGLFRDNRALWGQQRGHGFFYLSDQIIDDRFKLFQPLGTVALGAFSPDTPNGAGLTPRDSTSHSTSRGAARNLWDLNEARLETLRTRGVTSADLELLHGRAARGLEEATHAPDLAAREAALARSAALSQRVYAPLRTTMDDLVHAIVVLLLLAIPFAFALERLVICATTVYGRIGGFTAMFLLTFGLLYLLHPGFAIASTPIIVFLAFAIVLLSSLVIYIVVRKFHTELRAMQGQAAGLHEQHVSRAGTLLAAIEMGMSTMRRRPTRTLLTAVTVVMLTFTILSFASFSRTIGVRSVYTGPRSPQMPSGILLRKLDYAEMPRPLLDMLRTEGGADGLIAPHYWLTRTDTTMPRIGVARAGGPESLAIGAVLGLPPEELERWPELAGTLGTDSVEEKQAALRRGEVFLPGIVQEVLGLEVGDEVLIHGKRARFGGALDAPLMQRIRHLDAQSLLPVDFQDASSQPWGGTSQGQSDGAEALVTADVDRDFVHLSSDQVVVASAELVRELGGTLHSITIHPGSDVDAVELGRRVAELVVMPVWASGADGVERLILTVLTDLSGGFALFFPLLLGGLIIFGTLLGSISDREKEIYTFSALGLSPGHVGALFFAEAAVYAIVGGMGGQLVTQLAGFGASHLARAGYTEPGSINYSSTNSLFAIAVVMATVMISAIYPAIRASRSANPGVARSFKLPAPQDDDLELTFPFTVSAHDITGVVGFLAEHFERHDDAGLGTFAASEIVTRTTATGHLELSSRLALAPYDLGVTERMTLTAIPSEIPGVDEVHIHIRRESGARGDWYRANRVFLRDLRRQFLLWRTLSHEIVERYRMRTLEQLGAEAIGES